MKVEEIKPGDTLRAKGGELMTVVEINQDEFKFQMRDPKTKELDQSGRCLTGPTENLKSFIEKQNIEKIDLESYEPTGLVSLTN